MQAILLATGESERLQPLTERIPSAMLPVANRPIIAWNLDLLARYGCRSALIHTHIMQGHVEAYVRGGNRWGVQVNYRHQQFRMGSAGALQLASDWAQESCVALPADMMLDIDLESAFRWHHKSGRALTLIVSKPRFAGDKPINPICVSADSDLLHSGSAQEDGEPFSFVNACIFEPSLLSLIPSDRIYDIYSDLLPALAKANVPVGVYHDQGYWNPLATFEQYNELQTVLNRSAYPDPTYDGDRVRFPMIRGRQVAPGIHVSPNHLIHPTAKITPPVTIGENCRIGREVELGPNVMIGNNVIIEDEATLRDSVALDNTYIGRLVKLEEKIAHQSRLIDAKTGVSVDVTDPFLLTEAGTPQLNHTLSNMIDRIFAGIALILLSPLLALIAVGVSLTTNRRILNRQEALGAKPNGKLGQPVHFQLLSFQTKRPNGQESRFSAWLREWEWHRLPALWHVMRGQMKLVGVTPLPIEEAERVPAGWGSKRFDRPAGFTGAWFTDLNAHSDWQERLLTDVHYVLHRTFAGDLRILRRTPAAWNRRRWGRQENKGGESWSRIVRSQS